MKLELRPRVVSDLVGNRRYLMREAGEVAGEKVRRHLQQRLRRLADKPDLGIATRHPDFRVLSPTKYPYRIYYASLGASVVVLHTRHTSRQAPQLDDL